MSFSGIIVAAGSGSRAGGDKQWRALGGKPVLRWSAEALLNAGADELVVVVAAGVCLRRRLHLEAIGEAFMNLIYSLSNALHVNQTGK